MGAAKEKWKKNEKNKHYSFDWHEEIHLKNGAHCAVYNTPHNENICAGIQYSSITLLSR